MNNKQVTYMPVTPGDAPLLGKIALQAYKDHYTHLWYDKGAWYMQKCFSIQQLEEELADRNALFFIVLVNGNAAGFIKLNIDAPVDNELRALELERIYFMQQYSGRGIGTAAVNHVFAMAHSLNKKIVWLKVMDSSTNAIAFYKKLGFEICGTYRLNFPQMKPHLRGMFIMKRHITEPCLT
jgi:ribosomal protein S18 acetylase RimI-like enzyme